MTFHVVSLLQRGFGSQVSLFPFSFSSSLRRKAWEKVAWDKFHEAQKNTSDNRSKPVTKRVQLYSRTSKNHIQIKGKRIDSLGKDGSDDGMFC